MSLHSKSVKFNKQCDDSLLFNICRVYVITYYAIKLFTDTVGSFERHVLFIFLMLYAVEAMLKVCCILLTNFSQDKKNIE